MRSSARLFCPRRNTRSVVKALNVTSSTEPTSARGLVQSSFPKSQTDTTTVQDALLAKAVRVFGPNDAPEAPPASHWRRGDLVARRFQRPGEIGPRLGSRAGSRVRREQPRRMDRRAPLSWADIPAD